MKKSLRRFIKLSWHGIPIGIIASVLICTAVVAAAYIGVTQTITQKITEPYVPPPPDYGEIIAPEIALANLETGKTFTKVVTDGVTVDLKADGAGKTFNIAPDPSELYTFFSVELVLTDKPAESQKTIGMGWKAVNQARVGTTLDAVGLYTFTETIKVTAGNAPGTATSTVAFTLEEAYPEPPPHD
ncbi:hypothetical protein ES708_09071 [subsurface metagenome]